jgi:hypothetical protein
MPPGSKVAVFSGFASRFDIQFPRACNDVALVDTHDDAKTYFSDVTLCDSADGAFG